MNNWRLLLTRSAPDCQLQAQHLASLNIPAYALPLLEIASIAETPQQRSQLLDFDRYTTLVVTSKPAAKFILERLDYYWPQLPIQQTWFTVGQATANILQEANLNVYCPPSLLGDDSESLWELAKFQENLANPQCRVLIIKGQNGRQWLLEKLELSGIATDTIELYQRKIPNYSANFILETLTLHTINALVVSSGEALQNFQQLLGKSWQTLNHLTYFVPSVRIAEQAKTMNLKHIINCHGANQNALIDALKHHQPYNLL